MIWKPTTADFTNLKQWLCNHFRQFVFPEIIETDGGPPFNGENWRTFLSQWGIRHRLSSSMYPESNSRAELGVKVAKRMIRDNTGTGGNLDTDASTRP